MLGSIRAAAILAAAICSFPVAAQNGNERDANEAFDRTPQDCIIASRIDRTEVIDDNTIVFMMRGGNEAYVNYLPQRCPNLAREDRFAYERRTSQLCDDATITVLEFSGIAPGFTCRLGQFQPVTLAEVEEIRRIAEREGRGRDIEVEEVDLPDDAGDANGAGDADGANAADEERSDRSRNRNRRSNRSDRNDRDDE